MKTNLKDSNDGPKERVKVFPVRDGVAGLRPEAEFTAEQMHPQDTGAKNGKNQRMDANSGQSELAFLCLSCIPEREDEQHQQHAERGHVVHRLHQHYELSPQGGQEADQL